jgi:very-short-patch-repair endonuclease
MIRVRSVDRRMPAPIPNADIFDELGCFIATTDLLVKQARIAIEYDGDRHRDETQFQRDLARDQLLVRAGYHVSRAGKRDLRPNATLFFDTLQQLLLDRTPAR